MDNVEFSYSAIIEINKKDYKGVLEADEEGLSFLSYDGQDYYNYNVDWESVKCSRSQELTIKQLFKPVLMINLSIISNTGSLPKIYIEEKEYKRIIKGFQTIKDCIKEHKKELKRAEELNRIKEEAEERRRQIRLQLEIEKNERYIRLNSLLVQAEKERLKKEEKKGKEGEKNLEERRQNKEERSQCFNGYKQSYYTIIDSGIITDDYIVKKAEAKASKWVYENAKRIYQHADSLSNELYDFFKAYVLLQHNRDSIKFSNFP